MREGMRSARRVCLTGQIEAEVRPMFKLRLQSARRYCLLKYVLDTVVYQSARRDCLTARRLCLSLSTRCARQLDIVSSDKDKKGWRVCLQI